MLHTLPEAHAAASILNWSHENYNGSGRFGLSGTDIPLTSQILRLADAVEARFDLAAGYDARPLRVQIRRFVADRAGTWFSPETADAFEHLARRAGFWYELTPTVAQRALCLRVPVAVSGLDAAALRRSVRVLADVVRRRAAPTQHPTRVVGDAHAPGQSSVGQDLQTLGLAPEIYAALVRRDRRWRESSMPGAVTAARAGL